jgi:coniferyl-aldehyde dehydrogenase
MQNLLQAQRAYFQKSTPRNYEMRLALLNRLENMVRHNESALIEAVHRDFGRRATQETQLLELVPLLAEIRHCKRHLKRWMRPKKVSVDWFFQPARAKVTYQPLGVIGIMGAWNYPISLILTPLANALAAGNCAMIKPSELAPATSELIATLIQQTFSPDEVTVVQGGADVAAQFAALPFDHIVFTGSGRIGQKVLAASVQNLTPVTLELGGKSPAIIHASYDVNDAADKIISAKLWNAGQTCIAPDYVLLHESQCDAFVQAVERAIQTRLPSLVSNPHYTHMINADAWRRMNEIVMDAESRGARVLQFNPAHEVANEASGVFLPTLLLDVPVDARAMTEELFGPILPILTYRQMEEALSYVNERDRPLALYYFDDDTVRVDEVLRQVTAGGVSVNDCMLHYAQSRLPFGGVGASGMGAYHGHTGFLTFSKQMGVFVQNRLVAKVFGTLAKPPYSRWTDKLVRVLLSRQK